MHPSTRASLPVLLAGAAALSAAFFSGGCSAAMNLPSRWNDGTIVIDGSSAEWVDKYLIDDNRIMIGVSNDSSFVYLLLVTNDAQRERALMHGLTVWFDAEGGKEETFGIQYPAGGGFRGPRRNENAPADAPRTMTDRPAPPAGGEDIAILGPGKDDRHEMHLLEAGAIEVRTSLADNRFVYELKVPYRGGYPFSINAKPGSSIGVGLSTARMKGSGGTGMRPEGGGMGREGGEGGGMGGMGGGMRGGGRGGRGGGGGERSGESPDALDLWMKVPLVVKTAK